MSNKLKWVDEDKVSKLSNRERWSLFDIRKYEKYIEKLNEENEKLNLKIKKNSERIRKYKKGINEKLKLITSAILNENHIVIGFVYYEKKSGIGKKGYWNIRIIENGKIKKDFSLCSDIKLNDLLSKYDLKYSRIKKIEILNELLGNEIKEGLINDWDSFFEYNRENYTKIGDRMVWLLDNKLNQNKLEL